jgi:hypothetical protein
MPSVLSCFNFGPVPCWSCLSYFVKFCSSACFASEELVNWKDQAELLHHFKDNTLVTVTTSVLSISETSTITYTLAPILNRIICYSLIVVIKPTSTVTTRKILFLNYCWVLVDEDSTLVSNVFILCISYCNCFKTRALELFWLSTWHNCCCTTLGLEEEFGPLTLANSCCSFSLLSRNKDLKSYIIIQMIGISEPYP